MRRVPAAGAEQTRHTDLRPGARKGDRAGTTAAMPGRPHRGDTRMDRKSEPEGWSMEARRWKLQQVLDLRQPKTG